MAVDTNPLLELWREAEARLKRTERVRGELIIPSVNELRYAGYHLLEALSASDDAVAAANLEKAQRHCKRATYDAVEAEVLYSIRRFDEFRADYKDLVLTEVAGLHWLELAKTIRSAQKFVREQSGQDSRDDYYEGLMVHCNAIEIALDACEAARDELNKICRTETARRHAEVEQRHEESKKVTRRWQIGTAVAVVAALAAWAKIGLDWSRVPSAVAAPSAPAVSASAASVLPGPVTK